MQLSDEVVAEIKHTLSLVKHHRNLADLLERTVHQLVEKEAGINLAEGNWELDLEKGSLTNGSAE